MCLEYSCFANILHEECQCILRISFVFLYLFKHLSEVEVKHTKEHLKTESNISEKLATCGKFFKTRWARNFLTNEEAVRRDLHSHIIRTRK